jgi:FAD/FMN-containing dehydrogenase
LAYARLSVSPSTYLTETAVHTFERVPADAPLPKLEVDGHTALERFVINFSKTGDWGRWVRWELERRLVPSAHACTRNEAMSRKEVCVISRNQKMYDSMGYLKNRLRDTDILQEYFVPREQFVAFVDGLRETVESTGANLLNVTVRNVRRDEITALPYARDDVFGLVLYFNQKLSVADAEALEETTRRLIDLSLGLDGTFYLPYQLYYTREQLEKAYPNVGAFFEVKRRYDPDGLLTNTWYEKYGTKDVVE